MPPADFAVPGQALSFVSDLVVLDHRIGTVMLIATVLNDGVDDADALWADAQARLDALQTGLAQPSEAWLAEVDLATPADPVSRTRREDYLAAVGDASKQYIRDGDVFQVVISQRFDLECTARSDRRLPRAAHAQPEPVHVPAHASSARTASAYSIVGSSPEALVKVQDGRVFTHPIAGSRPRGATPEEDLELDDELLGRRQGAGRAPDARRPRPQRPAQGLRGRHRSR